MGTSDRCWAYVRFGPKADVRRSAHEVCFVPVADSVTWNTISVQFECAVRHFWKLDGPSPILLRAYSRRQHEERL
jgi:hypothetical protein